MRDNDPFRYIDDFGDSGEVIVVIVLERTNSSSSKKSNYELNLNKLVQF